MEGLELVVHAQVVSDGQRSLVNCGWEVWVVFRVSGFYVIR